MQPLSETFAVEQPKQNQDGPGTIAVPQLISVKQIIRSRLGDIGRASKVRVNDLRVSLRTCVPASLVIIYAPEGVEVLNRPYWSGSTLQPDSKGRLLCNTMTESVGGDGGYVANVQLSGALDIQFPSPGSDATVTDVRIGILWDAPHGVIAHKAGHAWYGQVNVSFDLSLVGMERPDAKGPLAEYRSALSIPVARKKRAAAKETKVRRGASGKFESVVKKVTNPRKSPEHLPSFANFTTQGKPQARKVGKVHDIVM